MAKSIKKSAVSAADTKELRSLAATAGVKFIGKKSEDLRKELLGIAVDDSKPAKKVAKSAKKPAEKSAGKSESIRREVSEKDLKAIEKYDTKKAKVISLRELGYSINAIGEAVGLHPTNVSRYVRDAGLSTSTATVPAERIKRIKATIASKKPAEKTVKAASVKAAPAKKEVKKAKAKVK